MDQNLVESARKACDEVRKENELEINTKNLQGRAFSCKGTRDATPDLALSEGKPPSEEWIRGE